MPLEGELELTLAERLALQRFRQHATVPSNPAPAHHFQKGLASLNVLLQERDLLEASLARVRPQRAPSERGAKKLQSSYPTASTVEGSAVIRGSQNDNATVPGRSEGHGTLARNTDIYVPATVPRPPKRTPRTPDSAETSRVSGASAGRTIHDVQRSSDSRKPSPDIDNITPDTADERTSSPTLNLSLNLHDITMATLED